MKTEGQIIDPRPSQSQHHDANREAEEAEGFVKEYMPGLFNEDGTPNEDWVRGSCPQCGSPLVSLMRYVEEGRYQVVWQCWGSMQQEPACDYYRVL